MASLRSRMIQEKRKTESEEPPILLITEQQPRPRGLAAEIAKLRHPSFQSYVYLLFVFVHIGFAVHYSRQNPTVIFTINLIAIFPSSSLLDYGLDQVGQKYGDLVKALLYMTFGYDVAYSRISCWSRILANYLLAMRSS